MIWKMLKRAGLGFILGIAIGNIIACLFGSHVVAPALIEKIGSEQGAFLLQTLLSGVYGTVCFVGIGFYDIERWPLLASAVTHWALILLSYIPVAFYLCWIDTWKKVLHWAIYATAAYILVYCIILFIYRRQAKEMNDMMKK